MTLVVIDFFFFENAGIACTYIFFLHSKNLNHLSMSFLLRYKLQTLTLTLESFPSLKFHEIQSYCNQLNSTSSLSSSPSGISYMFITLCTLGVV